MKKTPKYESNDQFAKRFNAETKRLHDLAKGIKPIVAEPQYKPKLFL